MRLRLSTKIIIAFVVAMLLAWAGLLVIGYALVGQPFHEMLHFQQSLEATELITSSARESLLYSLAFIALIAVVGGAVPFTPWWPMPTPSAGAKRRNWNFTARTAWVTWPNPCGTW